MVWELISSQMETSTQVNIDMASLGAEEGMSGHLEQSTKENLRMGISMERVDGRKSK